MEKTDEDIHNYTHETVKFNKGRTTKVYEISTERKKILKERREKVLQNAKDGKTDKENVQAVLQASTRVTKVSKVTQDIKMTDNATTGKGSTVDVHLPPHSHGKAKYPSQIKISSKYRTASTEPLLGKPPSRQSSHCIDKWSHAQFR